MNHSLVGITPYSSQDDAGFRDRDRDKTGKTQHTKMPSAPTRTAEEARLLGTMPVDPMDDIELRSVQLQ
ncbi:hypothetical protein DOY81_014918, partial [Sarcophaga bullata]